MVESNEKRGLLTSRVPDINIEVDLELCKDAEGKWTKWVPERCTKEELVLYNELKEKIQAQEGAEQEIVLKLDEISENQLLRFLDGWKWNVEHALQGLFDAEKCVRELKPWEVKKEDIQHFLDMKCFALCGHDKVGHRVCFVKAERYQPYIGSGGTAKKMGTDYDPVAKFQWQLNQYLIDTCKPHVDQWVFVYDCSKFGYSNFDLKMFKAISPIVAVTSGRRNRVYCIGGGMIISGVWGMLKPFIAEKSRKKLIFIKKAADLLEYVDADQLPSDLAGTASYTVEEAIENHFPF